MDDFVTFASPPNEEPRGAADAQHAELAYIVLNPLFKRQSKLLLREVLRLHRKKCLTYRLFADRPIQDVFGDMVQVGKGGVKPRSLLSIISCLVLRIVFADRPIQDVFGDMCR
jgi:hypothetical protein